jgi:hypothetical protein
MSLETDAVWGGGVWASTVWADGVWSEEVTFVAVAVWRLRLRGLIPGTQNVGLGVYHRRNHT